MINLFRRLFRRSKLDDEVREEIASHLAMRAEQNRGSGMSEKASLYAAQRQFGNTTFIQEQIYQFNSFSFLDSVCKDLRYTFRGMCRNPGLSMIVVLTIAIGVGAATSMFDLMQALLLAPPAHVTEQDRVFRLHQVFPGLSRDEAFVGTSYPFYQKLASNARSLDSVACYTGKENLSVGSGLSARMARAVMVSAGFWRTLKTRPRLGRFIADEEAHPATGSRVVVLGYGFWQSEFGGRSEVVGSTLRIKGQPYEIIGVVPRGFRGIELADVDLWLPLFAIDDGSSRAVAWHTFGANYNMRIVLRLKPDVTVEHASGELSILQRVFLEDSYGKMFDPVHRNRGLEPYRHARVLLGSMTGGLGDDLRPVPEARVAVWLTGMACVLLVIACSNVSGLLVLRAMRRRREIAVRLALGVSRGRLTRQFMTESVVLALLGGLAAVLAVIFGGVWLQRTLLPAMGWEQASLINVRSLAVAGVCIIGAAFTAGMAPLLYARSGGESALHHCLQRGPGRRPRMQMVLLAIQSALSVVLLIQAGLFVRSLHNARTVDIGLDRDNVLVVQLDFTGSGRTSADEAAFFEQALNRVSSLPGVARASLASNLPLRSAGAAAFRLPGRNDQALMPNGEFPYTNAVTPGFFATTGMRIREGRDFLASERNRGDAVVVSESMARLCWPNRSPIGECVYLQRDEGCARVVGVVADTRMFKIVGDRPHPYWYRPLAVGKQSESSFPHHALLVRLAPDISRIDNSIRLALNEIDSQLPFIKIETLGEALDPEIRPWRLGASVFTAFGFLAMILAVIGIWSSVSYAVSQRINEFAVRTAMGANRRSLVGLMVKEGLRNALIAIAAGLAAAVVNSRFVGHLLYGVSPHDPVVFASVASVIFLVAAVASLVPALRVARIDPAQVLRSD